MREFQLEELATYGHCPMKWRYRYEYQLPYIEADSQEAYFFSVRKALARYTHGYFKKGRKNLAKSAEDTFKQLLAKFEFHGVFEYAESARLFQEGWMAIIAFDRQVVSEQDFKPSAAADTTGYTYFEDTKISGLFDIVLDPPRGYSNDSVAVCHITNERSSLYSPRFMPVKYGWTVAVLRDAMGPKTKIFHSTFSPWAPKGLSLTKNVYSRTSFTGTMRGLIKGVKSRAVWQIPHRERCKKCCYNLICDSAHSRNLKRNEIKVLYERMKGWNGRRAASAARKRSIGLGPTE